MCGEKWRQQSWAVGVKGVQRGISGNWSQADEMPADEMPGLGVFSFQLTLPAVTVK